ncbi:MCA1 [Symbiodinium sp. CCMP2456]|nr:MCA1 [Symbiodinium sp. CCMP2456]
MGKRALCVGVNYPGQEYQLYGCVNDCLDWERMLKEAYEFEETRVLIDQYPDGTPTESGAQLPTRANILAQLGGWLVAGAQPGDVLVFVFAGHGCQARPDERV